MEIGAERVSNAERFGLLCRRTLAAGEAEEVVALEHTAAEGFGLLDRMEVEDATRGVSG